MKCKICGHRTSGEKALPNMMKHYRQAHPQKLTEKRVKRADKSMEVKIASSLCGEHDRAVHSMFGYCPHCGKSIK